MSDASNWTASDLSRELIKKANKGQAGAPPEVLSAPTRQAAMMFANYILYYDSDHPENPDDITDDEFYRLMLSRLETLTAIDSVRTGDVSSMRAVAGAPDSERVDASSLTWQDKMDALWKPEDEDHMLNLVLYAPPPATGPTGVGKTDAAYSVIEGGQMAYFDHGGLTVASNNTSDEFADVESWTELESWLEATDGTKCFLWDEAAQVLMFDDMDAGKALSNLIKLLRKHQCHLIVVGHTGKDIPKDIRRMVLFMLKESKEKATVGAGLEEDNAGWMQIKNVLWRTKNIPETSVEYKSIGDKGSFTFDQTEDGDEDAGAVSAPLCQAETNAGTRCPNDAKRPADNPVVCKSHTRDDIPDEGWSGE